MKILKKTKLYKLYSNTFKINEVNQKIENLEHQFQCLQKSVENIQKIANENLYATIFHDTIKNSQWLNIPLSLSSGAIGYPFAYILYRVLDEIKPKKILETGMGQSTKIITEFVKYHKNIEHHVVEHDKEWVKFFKMNTNMSEIQHIHLLDNYKKKYKGTELNAYKNFKEEFKGEKFNLISIDGPVGYSQEYSRMDILDILPDCLEKEFVILLDDCDRIGEQRTIELLEEKLRKNNITFHSGYQYWGTTSVYVCVSKDLEFLCHI